jgi:hypothetical protein
MKMVIDNNDNKYCGDDLQAYGFSRNNSGIACSLSLFPNQRPSIPYSNQSLEGGPQVNMTTQKSRNGVQNLLNTGPSFNNNVPNKSCENSNKSVPIWAQNTARAKANQNNMHINNAAITPFQMIENDMQP